MRPTPNKRRERLQAAFYVGLCVLVAAAGWIAVLLVHPVAASSAATPLATGAATPDVAKADLTPTYSLVTPGPSVGTPAPPATKAPYEIDLYKPDTFVSQINRDYCTAGAIQNMLNITLPKIDLSTAKQQQIGKLVVSLTSKADSHNGGFGPIGWANAMAKLGAGRYSLGIDTTFDKAMRNAAIALRRTGRPVGLLTWWGAHSWVMTGFKADSDPALFPRSFKLTGAYIVDPFYPRVSTIWGQTLPPDTFRDMAAMAHNYIGWKRPEGTYPGRDGNWLTVVPV